MTETADRVAKTLTARDLTLATAESLTGGLLGATITAVPGASRFYLGGVTAYDTKMKTALLGIDKAQLALHTAVSAETATAMAHGVSALTGADWVIAVTGVAGPDPQDGHEPGEVWVSVLGPQIASMPQLSQTEQYFFEGDRDAVRVATIEAALTMLLRIISPV